VRDALLHLYDTAYLQEHPLGAALAPAALTPAGVNSAQALRRALIEAIERLRPASPLPYSAKEWRPYRILFDRYVQQTCLLDVQRELAISDRQYQREHSRALYALACLLWEAAPQQSQPVAGPGEDAPEISADISRFVAGAQREALDGEQLVLGALRAVEKLAASREIAIEVTCAPNLPPIYGDRGLLRQIVLNLLSYLLGARERATLRIAVEQEGDDVHLAFAASGQGAGDDCGRIEMSRSLAEAVGGELEIEGGAIHLRLPLQRQVLLVVDDNEDVIELFSRYLAGGAFKVVGARTAEQALALARETRPFLITLDVMMPTHDGWEALQNLKHTPATADIPVAVCSILNEPELAYSLGADDYIKKPVTQKELLALLARWRKGEGAGA